jgi:uncharacterized cupin superfamily protein
MEIADVPFTVTTWSEVPRTEHGGKTGKATWQTLEIGNLRVRVVKYAPGYAADHWCTRGHVVFVLEGELVTVLKDGRRFALRPGMSYQVASQAEAHKSSTPGGARLFIVD